MSNACTSHGTHRIPHANPGAQTSKAIQKSPQLQPHIQIAEHPNPTNRMLHIPTHTWTTKPPKHYPSPQTQTHTNSNKIQKALKNTPHVISSGGATAPSINFTIRPWLVRQIWKETSSFRAEVTRTPPATAMRAMTPTCAGGARWAVKNC